MKSPRKLFNLFFIVILFFLCFSNNVFANKNADDLKQDILNKTSELQKLGEQAERIQKEILKTGSKKASLKRELSLIKQEEESLQNSIKQTRLKISLLDSQILKNKSQINIQQKFILNQVKAIESLLRKIDQIEKISFLEKFFNIQKFSNLFIKKDHYSLLQPEILTKINELRGFKKELKKNIKKLSEKQNNLEQEKIKLHDQNNIILKQAEKKQKIIKETQNKETIYQQNLKETLSSIKNLDREIRNYESQLKFILDKKSIPEKGSAPFVWPLDRILITQRFGKTTASGRLYKSGSHSGMDFRASIGTPVYAVADGVVKGIGNTDLTCPGASFGKWIFIEHPFGLSTTFGHMSSVKVKEGQKINKGDLIGYSGNTGHTTAPHLHITVYATKGVNAKGVKIVKRASLACPGKEYRMPLAPTISYLDPLDYFPKASLSMFKHPSLAGA